MYWTPSDVNFFFEKGFKMVAKNWISFQFLFQDILTMKYETTPSFDFHAYCSWIQDIMTDTLSTMPLLNHPPLKNDYTDLLSQFLFVCLFVFVFGEFFGGFFVFVFIFFFFCISLIKVFLIFTSFMFVCYLGNTSVAIWTYL